MPTDPQHTFELPASEAIDLVDTGVATFFDPGHGRPMKQWIAVPATHAPRWRRLAEQARDHAAQPWASTGAVYRPARIGVGRA